MEKVKVNGIQIVYQRKGTGKSLVLVHGYPLDHTIWDEVLPLLEGDFDIILPDLRGFGGSDIVESQYKISDMAADIAGLLDVLEIEKAAIAGHSMRGQGGVLAWPCQNTPDLPRSAYILTNKFMSGVT